MTEFKYDPEQFEGGAEDKCCICIELNLGVKILSIFGAIIGVAYAALGVLGILANLFVGLILVAFSLPQIAAGWLFIQYLKEDSKDTRDGLVKAGTYQLLASLLQAASGVLGALGILKGTRYDGMPIVNVASSVAIGVLLSYYFLTVFKRFAEK